MSLQSIATDQLKQAKVLGIDLGIILAVAVVAFYIAGSIKQGAYYSASLEKLKDEGYGNTGTAEKALADLENDGVPI